MSQGPTHRWLLLVHQLPAQPSKLRVKVWRRLQGVGAVLVKNSVYVLPNNSEAREDFEWIRGEIIALGGEAVVFTADAVDDLTTNQVIDGFVSARRADWEELRASAEKLHEVEAADEAGGDHLERDLKALRNRAAQIDKIDYFKAPGRQEATSTIEALAGHARTGSSASRAAVLAAGDFRGRRWLTRPHPGVDRMASAWLIRRFVDPAAKFRFAERISPDEDLVPFDMFGVDFGHHGEQCTFETLMQTFELAEPALQRIARIVHDLDLRSDAVGDPETATVGRLVDGLRDVFTDDPELLERGMDLFEALYRSFRSDPSGG